MTIWEALNNLRQVCESANLNIAQHRILQDSLQLVETMVNEKSATYSGKPRSKVSRIKPDDLPPTAA